MGEMTRMLVDAHPDAVRIRDNGKWNPLHYAAYRGNWEISQYLIEMNPDALMEENMDNKTPRAITVCNGRHQMAEKFREAEEDIQSGMMKITEIRDQSNIIVDEDHDKMKIKNDFINYGGIDPLHVDSLTSTGERGNADSELDSEEKNITQDELILRDKDYSYSRSMHDRLV